VTVSPASALDHMEWRLAHNVTTLRQRALGSATKMYQITTHGSWVKDADSTESISVIEPGRILIRGEDEPVHGYWPGWSFPHPLHIVENHKNFVQYRSDFSGEWVTIAVVEWGWTADVEKNGEQITTSGIIHEGTGYASSEIPITMPDIEDIKTNEIPIAPIN